jgi:hypothetical protein
MLETSSSHTTGVTGLRELRSFPGPGTRLAWCQLPKMIQAANCRRLAIRVAVVEGRKNADHHAPHSPQGSVSDALLVSSFRRAPGSATGEIR